MLFPFFKKREGSIFASQAKVSRKRLPFPASEITVRLPLCIYMICREILSPMPEPTGFGRKERYEDALLNVCRNACPVIADLDIVFPSALIPADSSIRGFSHSCVASSAFLSD